jgi:hypothetical protein
MKGILIIAGCAVLGYIIVSLLMNTRADDLRPPPDREDPPGPPRSGGEVSRQPAPAVRTLPAPRAAQGDDWTLLLDVPRSSSARDIEAAFRRQVGKAEASGDQAMVERLRRARDAALAEKKNG